MASDPPRFDLLQGTLDLLILRALRAGPMHGWAVSERIQQISNDILQVNQGSLYPALHRLEHRGWIKAEWGFRNWADERDSTRSRLLAGNSSKSSRRSGASSAKRLLGY